jgi:peptide/nickel transport system permease protein
VSSLPTAAPDTIAPAARPPQSPFRRIVEDFFSNPVATFGLTYSHHRVLRDLRAGHLATEPLRPRADRRDGRPAAPDSPTATGGTFCSAPTTRAATFSAIFYGLHIARRWRGEHGAADHRPGRPRGVCGGRFESLIARRRHPAVPGDPDRADRSPCWGRGPARSSPRWSRSNGRTTRTVRAAAMVEKRKEYMEAARCLALPPSRIVFRTCCRTACRR